MLSTVFDEGQPKVGWRDFTRGQRRHTAFMSILSILVLGIGIILKIATGDSHGSINLGIMTWAYTCAQCAGAMAVKQRDVRAEQYHAAVEMINLLAMRK